jgi:hypothetical protein
MEKGEILIFFKFSKITKALCLLKKNIYLWIPRGVAIYGNTVVDYEDKDVLKIFQNVL